MLRLIIALIAASFMVAPAAANDVQVSLSQTWKDSLKLDTDVAAYQERYCAKPRSYTPERCSTDFLTARLDLSDAGALQIRYIVAKNRGYDQLAKQLFVEWKRADAVAIEATKQLERDYFPLPQTSSAPAQPTPGPKLIKTKQRKVQ